MDDFERAGPGDQVWKVGAVAELTGLTVRALHHYDHIGLLVPSRRSRSGHRLYDGTDVARLYRICVLRRLGFSLEQVADVLDDPQWQIKQTMQRHLEDTRRRAGSAAELATRLSRMSSALDEVDLPTANELFATIEEMTKLEPTVRGTTALLVYDDLPTAHGYLVRVFGLTPGPLHHDEQNRYFHGEVSAGSHVIWLHPPGSDYLSPKTVGAATGMTVINVDDADAHYRRCLAAGADVIEEPINQPYGVREWGARDLEGQLWYFHSPLQ